MSQTHQAATESVTTNDGGVTTTPAVIITPEYDLDTHETTVTIRGLKKGAHVVVSVPGEDDDRDLFIGKRGKIHAFGFAKNTGTGPVKICG